MATHAGALPLFPPTRPIPGAGARNRLPLKGAGGPTGSPFKRDFTGRPADHPRPSDTGAAGPPPGPGPRANPPAGGGSGPTGALGRVQKGGRLEGILCPWDPRQSRNGGARRAEGGAGKLKFGDSPVTGGRPFFRPRGGRRRHRPPCSGFAQFGAPWGFKDPRVAGGGDARTWGPAFPVIWAVGGPRAGEKAERDRLDHRDRAGVPEIARRGRPGWVGLRGTEGGRGPGPPA